MGKLTDDKPKCFVKIREKRLIDIQLEMMRNAGIAKIAIVTGYMNDAFSEIGDKRFYNPDWSNTQMFKSLSFANEWLEKYSCIITYSDIFFSKKIVEDLIKAPQNICIAYDKDWHKLWSQRFENPLSDAESFKLDDNSYLQEIGQKANCVEEICGQFMGLIKTTPKGWKTILEGCKHVETETLNNIQMTQLVSKLMHLVSLKVKCIENTDAWGEIDSVKDLQLYNSEKGKIKNNQ